MEEIMTEFRLRKLVLAVEMYLAAESEMNRCERKGVWGGGYIEKDHVVRNNAQRWYALMRKNLMDQVTELKPTQRMEHE